VVVVALWLAVFAERQKKPNGAPIFFKKKCKGTMISTFVHYTGSFPRVFNGNGP